MDENDVSRGVPPTTARISSATATQLLTLITRDWGKMRSFIIIFTTYTFLASVYTSRGDLGTILYALSSLSILGTIRRWFRDLSWLNPGGPPALIRAAWTASCDDLQCWSMAEGGEAVSSRLSSTFTLLPAGVFSCFVAYSAFMGCYEALGDATAELFTACYLGILVICYYQYLLFLIIGSEAPTLLPLNTRFELAIWYAELALAMWVSSNSISLYPSQPRLLVSDTAAFHILLMTSGRLLRSGILEARDGENAEDNIFNKWGPYYALLLFNFVFRISVLSSPPAELVASVILFGVVNVAALWDIGQAGTTAYSGSNITMAETVL